MSDDRLLHIGDVADRVGLSLRTVRYYEEQGLLEPAGRTEGGFRLYAEEQVARLALIKRMKPLGFTVQQMRELLDARDALRSGDEAERRGAMEQLTAYADAAAERCAELRRQLDHASAFTEQLRDEARRGGAGDASG
ncbi:MAG TPA: MerR family transcriptional regulator [Baekduia sp.]|nr:MerR family transcriptional regulator [Baekduia sp.]